MSSMPQHARPSSSSSLQQYQHQHQQHQQQSSAKKPGWLPPHSPCRLSSEAYRGKIDWEAKYRKPCPYARPAGEGCPYIRRSARTCFSEHMSSDDDVQPPEGSLSRGLLISVPGAPQRDFGSGFSREIDDPACQESSLYVEREPDDSDGVAAAAAAGATTGSVRREAVAAQSPAAAPPAPAPAATSPKRRKNGKNSSGRSNKKSGVKRRVPTLLKIHQRVIEDALFELTRSREEAFENLGERLGGEPEDFTFYDGTFNFAAGLPARLPAYAAQRRKFARNRRKLHQRTRGQPNTFKGTHHRAQTDHAYRGIPLPRFKKNQESWKIPLLRVPTPTNGENQDFTRATTFGKIISLGSHPQQASSSAAAAAAGQSQSYPGRYSASCPPRKVRKNASGGRKHPRTVEGSGKRGRGVGGGRSEVENEPSGGQELPDGRPSEEVVERSDHQQRSLLTTARGETSGQGQHEASHGTNEESIFSAPFIEGGGPRDTTRSGDRAIAAAGVTAATTADALDGTAVAWSGETHPATEIPECARVRAEKCVDEIVSKGMRTHLVAASSGVVSTPGSRTLPTSAEADDARSGEAAIASLEANAPAKKFVDDVLPQHLLRPQPVSDLTIETTTRSRPQAAEVGPERCVIQGGAAAGQYGGMEGGMERQCVNKEIPQASHVEEVAANDTSIACVTAATDAEEGSIGLHSGAVGSGYLSIGEAKRFVEEVVSDVLLVHLRAAFGEEVRSPSPSTEAEQDYTRSSLTTTAGAIQPSVLEQVVNDAVRQSLHAAVVAALSERYSESSTAGVGLDEPLARLAKATSKRPKNGATPAMQSNASGEETTSSETATRTPTTMSSGSSSHELSPSREPSADVVPHLDENIAHDGNIIHDDDATAPPGQTSSSPGHRSGGMDSPVKGANSAETLAPSAISPEGDVIRLTSLHGANLGEEEEERRQEPNAYPGMAAKGLPVGFLDAIVAGRVSLKPAVPATTSRSSTSVRPSPSELRLQKERMEAEAKQRVAVLCEFEDLVRTERLDRYAPQSFSRGAVHGEGKHSVVYRADAVGRLDAKQRVGEEREQEQEQKKEKDPHAAGCVIGGGVIAAATAAMADIVTTAAVGAIMATTATTTTTTSDAAAEPSSKTLAAGVVISVMAASVSSVAARKSREHDNTTTKLLSLAAKEFRYTRQDAPVSILRNARLEVCAHLRVAGCAHVIALRGVWLTPRVTLLLEPMDVGNLHDFIRDHNREETRLGEDEGRGGGLTPAGAAWLLAEVAGGLAALHDAGVVHRDVKSHNVMMLLRRQPSLVDDGNDDDVVGRSSKCEKGIESGPIGRSEWEAKLGDLGSAVLVPTQGQTALMEEAGTSGWVAPEVSYLIFCHAAMVFDLARVRRGVCWPIAFPTKIGRSRFYTRSFSLTQTPDTNMPIISIYRPRVVRYCIRAGRNCVC